MWYLFLQMWFWILLSFALGWFAHWFLCCRNKNEEQSVSAKIEVIEPEKTTPINEFNESNQPTFNEEITQEAAEEPEVKDDWKPEGFSEKPQQEDDLKRIRGIGKVNEKALNELGIYRFAQIASWSPENIKWVEGFLAFPGRISREEWVAQATTLADGGSTDFASKVDKGEVDYGDS